MQPLPVVGYSVAAVSGLPVVVVALVAELLASELLVTQPWLVVVVYFVENSAACSVVVSVRSAVPSAVASQWLVYWV